MLPPETPRLRFREMTDADLDRVAMLLGDPVVMQYYPAPKTREQAMAWIDWNRANYAEHTYGLWIIEQHDGRFLGDCGLTWQHVNGVPTLEVGYHLLPDVQGRGFATEAAVACRDLAQARALAPELVAIIHPKNAASRRVAEKLGMVPGEDDVAPDGNRTVMRMRLCTTHLRAAQARGPEDAATHHAPNCR